jgi:23S rRNA (guanosine2251-2'-O)-methyltransferase
MTAEQRKMVVGRHAVSSLLAHQWQMIDELMLVNDDASPAFQALLDSAFKNKVKIRRVPRSYLDSIAGSAVHQGVAVCLIAEQYSPLEDIIGAARAAGPHALVLIADHVQDPHNLGAIMRSAAAAGAQGVVIAKDRACQLTPAVSKAAAGALGLIRLCRVSNLAYALERLRDEAGLWSLAATPGQYPPPWEQDLGRPLALIIGGEHQGVSHRLLQLSDMKTSLPLAGEMESLNASVAAGALLFEIIRQQRQPGSAPAGR